MSKMNLSAVCLTLILTLSLANLALAQCGGNSGSMHDQHQGSSGNPGYGQMGMYGQGPVPTDPNAVAPGYVAPAPPASGYAEQQNPGGYGSGQMMNQSGMGSGHSGHGH